MAGVGRPSRRDNFTSSVIQILYKRSGGKCCNCGATTFGPHTSRQEKYQNIGQAAHIAAAAPGGPRFNPRMSQEERTSVANGLWLCSNCHSIVDRDTSKYTTVEVKAMKRRGEERARRAMGVANPEVINTDRADETPDILRATISATAIVDIRKAKSSLLQFHGLNIDQNEAEKFLDTVAFINFEMDSYRSEVGSELIALLSKLSTYCGCAEVNMEVIRQFKFVLECFNSSWSTEEVEVVGSTLYNMTRKFGRRTKTYQSAVALLKDIGSNKALRAKKLHAIPLALLNDINREGGKRGRGQISADEVDVPAKFLRQDQEEHRVIPGHGAADIEEKEEEEDGEGEFTDYLELMTKLVDAEDEGARELESKLMDMGYEPDIV